MDDTPDDEAEQTDQRSTGDGPWCWQGKALLNTIGEIFDATNNVASARSVYVALTEIASDEQSEGFTRSIAEIARRAGVGYKTCAACLARFATLGLVRIERNVVEGTKELAPSTYRLVNGCPTLGNDRNRPSLPRVQKNLRRISEESPKKGAHRTKGAVRTRLNSFSPKLAYPKSAEEMYATLDSLGIDTDPDHDGDFFGQMQKSDWTIEGQPVRDWPKAYAARLRKTKPKDFPSKGTPAQRTAAKRAGEYAEDFSHL